MTDPVRVLIADDHPLFRDGLAALLRAAPDTELAGAAATGTEAVGLAGQVQPDVVLMDLRLPGLNGIEATRQIVADSPHTAVVVLTMFDDDDSVFAALRAGARAYLLKDSLDKELLDAIRAVHAGRKAISPEISFQLAEHATDDALTKAEIDVLRLIAEGNANKMIADQLGITEDTVKGRVKNILSKLGANDRTHAAMIGLKRGIIEL